MAVTITRDGYGQVEPNHLSAHRAGRVYAQLPAAAAITQLEQGMFVKYDYAAGQCAFSGNGPWFMVYNEEKLYDPMKQMHKDYVMKAADFMDGKMYPRVFGLLPGDIWTTNMIKLNDSLSVGDYVKVGSDGVLTKDTAGTPVDNIIVVKETTMPDGQPAVKLQYLG